MTRRRGGGREEVKKPTMMTVMKNEKKKNEKTKRKNPTKNENKSVGESFETEPRVSRTKLCGITSLTLGRKKFSVEKKKKEKKRKEKLISIKKPDFLDQSL